MAPDITLRFVVGGKPVGQPRHQAGRILRGRRAGRPIMYLPADHAVHPYKQAVRLAAAQAIAASGDRPYFPLSGPVAIQIQYLMAPSRAMAKVLGKRPPAPGLPWAATAPDLDNLDKAVWDALKGLAWGDDRQVCEATSQRLWAWQCAPATYVVLRTLDS